MNSNLLNDKLGLLKEWKQTESLNEILYNTLSALTECINDRFEKLAAEIHQETSISASAPVIRTAVGMTGENNIFLSPASTNLPESNPNYLTTIFAECEYNLLHDILDRSFQAELVTNNSTYTTNVKLRYSEKYLRELKNLYQGFHDNDIPWSTVNGTYLLKFFDIFYSGEIDDEITDFKINFAELSDYITYDKELLWNVRRQTFPVAFCESKPAYNTIVFEHIIKHLQRPDTTYIVCPLGERISAFWRGSDLCVRTKSKALEQIELFRITDGEDPESMLYLPPLSNQKKVNTPSNPKCPLPTRGEAERILHSLVDVSGLHLIAIRSLPPAETNLRRFNSIDYNYYAGLNSFLQDRKLLLFSFTSDPNTKWVYETMFFALSELQLHFYEYRCVGEIK